MKFEMVHHDPDGDEAGPDKPLGIVVRRSTEPGIDLGAVVDQFCPAGKRDVGLSGALLVGERDPTGAPYLRGFAADPRGQEPAGPEILAGSAPLRLDHARICDAILRRSDHPEERHFDDCVARRRQQPIKLRFRRTLGKRRVRHSPAPVKPRRHGSVS